MISLERVEARISAHRNLWVVAGAFLLTGFETSMVGVVWQPFVLSLGASMSVLGLLSSIGGMGGLVPTLLAPIAGWFADRRGRKIIILSASLAAISAYALYTFAGLTRMALALAPGIVLAGFSYISRPALNALTGESVRAERHGSAYSLTMFANILPGILAPLLAGWLADRAGFTAVFPLALVAEAISFALVARYLLDQRGWRGPVDWSGLETLLRGAWLPPKGLRGLFAISAMDGFSWGMGWGLLYGLLTKQYGFDAAKLGILSSTMSLSWAIMQLPIGRLIDRRGVKSVLAFSEATGAPLLFIWMTQSRFEIFVASMPLFALNAALWVPARSTYITRAVAPESRAETFGRLSAFVGLIALSAPFIGGFLFDHFGYQAPLLANLVGSFLTTVAIILFVREPERNKILS